MGFIVVLEIGPRPRLMADVEVEQVAVIDKCIGAEPRPCCSSPVMRNEWVADGAVGDTVFESLRDHQMTVDQDFEVAVDDAAHGFQDLPVDRATTIVLEGPVVGIGSAEMPVIYQRTRRTSRLP